MRDIRITAVMNGYVCKVGCQSLVFGSRGDLMQELDRYLRNPEETERLYTLKYPMQNSVAPEFDPPIPSIAEDVSYPRGIPAATTGQWTGGNQANAIPTPSSR